MAKRLAPSVFPLVDVRRAADGRVVVFTDGSATNNQDEQFRRAGFGAYWGPDHPSNTGLPLAGEEQTNNAAELHAQLFSLENDARPLEIRSDSEYVLDSIPKLPSWRANGWRPRRLATVGARTSRGPGTSRQTTSTSIFDKFQTVSKLVP